MEPKGDDGVASGRPAAWDGQARVSSTEDRRRFRRFLEQVTVRFRDIEGVTPSRWGRTRNLSLGGACLVTPEPVVVGAHLVLEIHVESETAPILVLARTLRSRSEDEDEGYATGLEFLWLGEEDRRNLRRLSDHFRRQHGETGE